ncbi:Zinc finger CCCH domain-containing protein 7 [Acorus calamus]|uniref:Zinc finger CCCH domain-containing protein 7 n=1 Tax=Acorus calamus TaxID=4465 RepID=A0AAV9DJH6_ACOCL|nr:Zinc finger CCCH domain-containing protein 7 [Acorus calamus]
MQLVQKRGTIYTISTGGFSLRKSGVLSIGGSSLKWSKSIEKRSKKTSEEATLAVVEAERKKKEQKGSVHVNQKKVSRISCRSACGIKLNQGERIFRVGSIRYKMDSSKHTLIRIPDDQITRSDHQQGSSGQPSFVPRRLLIGNDEYDTSYITSINFHSSSVTCEILKNVITSISVLDQFEIINFDIEQICSDRQW